MNEMKMITATMAKNLINKMEGHTEIQATMEKIFFRAMRGENCVSVYRAGMPTEQWQGIQVFFLGLGYAVEERTAGNRIWIEITW